MKVSRTLYLPLIARARETGRPDAIVRDPFAVRALALLPEAERLELDRFSQVGIAVRTILLDDAVKSYLAPDGSSVVVNLGAGLCTRYDRLGPRVRAWIELDLPEVIALRNRIFPENAEHRCVGCSVLDLSWLATLGEPPPSNVIFVAEGLLMYLEPPLVRTLLAGLAARFPGSLLLAEVVSRWGVRLSRWHPSVSKLGVRFRWGVNSSHQLARWQPGLLQLQEWPCLDGHPERWGWIGRVRRIGCVRNLLRIVAVRLEAEGGS